LDRTSGAEADPGLAERARILGVAEHTHRLARAGDLRAATRGVGVDRAQRLVDLAGADPERLHPRRIEDHPDFAIDAAGAADRGHALDRQQPFGDGIVDEPAQLLHRHVIGRNREIADRPTAADLDFRYARFEDAVGQVAANLVDRVLDL